MPKKDYPNKYPDNQGYDLGASGNIVVEDDSDGGVGLGANASGGATLLTPISTPSKPDDETTPETIEDAISNDEEAAGEPSDPILAAGIPQPPTIEIPGFDPNAAPLPHIEDAPAYEISPEQQAWADMHSGNIQNIIDQGGLGLSEEIQQLMMDKNNEALMARETEAIRLMKNLMARKGIDNWGLEFKNIQQIKNATTKEIAANIRDIQIQNALMKMSSFENALGMSAHFLDYLNQQSQLAHAPKMATWQMKQQAKLYQYQANIDIWKMKINQAYTVGNMQYAQELSDWGAAQQHQYNIELEQMKIDAAEEAAATQGFWQTVGSIIGFFAMFLL
jgi:hypothetical protein